MRVNPKLVETTLSKILLILALKIVDRECKVPLKAREIGLIIQRIKNNSRPMPNSKILFKIYQR